MQVLGLPKRLEANSRAGGNCLRFKRHGTVAPTLVATRALAIAANRRDETVSSLASELKSSRGSNRVLSPKRSSTSGVRRNADDNVDNNTGASRRREQPSGDRPRRGELPYNGTTSAGADDAATSSSGRGRDRNTKGRRTDSNADNGDRNIRSSGSSSNRKGERESRRGPDAKTEDPPSTGVRRREGQGRANEDTSGSNSGDSSRRRDSRERAAITGSSRSNSGGSGRVRTGDGPRSDRRGGGHQSDGGASAREHRRRANDAEGGGNRSDGGGSVREHRRRANDAAGDGAADTDPAATPAAPRPPGSSSGNRPLPYDIPIVRPYDGDKGTFFSGRSWRQVGASEEAVAALKQLGIARPSHIQALSMSQLLSPGCPRSLVLADQTGSGKTLAYLLPVMQMLRAEEAEAGGRVAKPNCPRAIVVAPTVELVQQVLRVARALSAAGLRCRSAAATGGQADDKARASTYRTQKELLSEGVDLLVSTPGRLAQLVAEGHVALGGCRALVMDEVDLLMGDHADFQSQVAPLTEAAPPSLRFLLVTATLPAHVWTALRESWGRLLPDGQAADLMPVFGPGLHRTAPGLVEELVDCSGGEEVSEESGRKRKLEALQSLLSRHASPRTLVFCNKVAACRDVENFLNRADPQQRKYRVLPYHEAIREDLRAQYMSAFLRPVSEAGRRAQQAAREAAQQQQREKEGQQEAGRQAERGEEGPQARKRQPRWREEEEEEQVREREAERSAEQQEDSNGGGGGVEAGDVPLVMVATDRTSRGIDAHYCEHVVLFDFPRDPSEYVRRVGRTARGAGGRGTVSSLVLGRQVPLAHDIIERNQKGMPVHTVPK